MIDFEVDKDKAKAALLYVCANVSNIDKLKLYKILYFAEQKHLIEFGRPITGDAFIKMKYGPVPSFVKDKIENKLLENDGSVNTDKNFVIANEYPDLDELSESDIKCLDDSIAENKDKSFGKLSFDSHKLAWNNAKDSCRLSSLDIALEGNAETGMLKYISSLIEDNLEFH
ncbi:DUF4065 domain-containing protein [bacterium]|nr:MAG: DUF4065 domain-containing protein [bacterium]